MADISFDPTSVIRVTTDAPTTGAATAPNPADSAPSFGEHLSRARRSSRPQPAADHPAPDPTQPAKSQGSKADDATPKATQDDSRNQPQKAAPDKQDDSAKDGPPADSGASAAAATAANPPPPAAPQEPTATKDAIQAAGVVKTADAALKAAAASQAPASQAATSPDAATAKQATAAQAAAQATAAQAAVSAAAVPQPAAPQPKAPQTTAQAANAEQTAPVNPQLAALIQATALKTTATTANAQASAAPSAPKSARPVSEASATKASLAAKTILAGQTSAPSPAAQAGANGPSQNSQDGSNSAAGVAAAVSAAAAQVVADVAIVKPAERGIDRIPSASSSQTASPLGQDPAASSPSAPQPQAPASGQLPMNANGFAAGVQARAGADGPSAATSDADRLRFVQRVTRAFQAAGDNGGQVKLRLSPPELGSLQLNITMKDGTMTAHIQAETSSAQNLLLNNLPDLRERLAQQDIRIERFDVDLMDHSPGGMPQTPDQNQNANDSGRRPPPSSNSPATAATEAAAPLLAASYQGSGGLNVVI